MIRIFLIAAALLFVSTASTAQTKPNLSGKWVLDREKTAAAAPAAAAGAVSPITIAMKAATLKITVPSKDGSGTTKTYTLDGPERKTIVIAGRGGETREEVSKATIEGARVVIRTTGTNGDSVASWYREGSWLVNERTSKTGTVTTFYKKG